jgi:hypothetical protein
MTGSGPSWSSQAGFSGPGALHIYRVLFGFLHGHALDELQELTVNPDETDDLLRLGLHRLPVSEFPGALPPPARPWVTLAGSSPPGS